MKPDAADIEAHHLTIIVRDRCHYVIDDGERVLIPGCLGAAVYGETGCTCEDAPGGNAELRALVEKLSEDVNRLRAEARTDARERFALRDRLSRLEQFMSPKPELKI